MHKLCLQEHNNVGYENEILTPFFLPHHALFYPALLKEVGIHAQTRSGSSILKSKASEKTFTPHEKPIASAVAMVSEPVIAPTLTERGLPSPKPL